MGLSGESIRVLAERAYPGLEPSGLCSRSHVGDEAGLLACSACYIDLRALIAEHNRLKQAAWLALQDIRQELTHGPTANYDYIERRFREGLDER